MKFSTLFFFVLTLKLQFLITNIECTKSYKFVKLEACKSNNEITIINKCEIDDIYISLNVDVKVPITKAMVSFGEFYIS
jgi:hypothetical protein